MKSLSLNFKITAILMIMVCVSIFIAYKAIDSLSAMNERITQIVQSTVPRALISQEINGHLLEIVRAEKNLIMAPTDSEKDKHKARINELTKLVSDKVDELAKLTEAKEGKDALNTFNDFEKVYLVHLAEVSRLATLNSDNVADKISKTESDPIYGTLRETLESVSGKDMTPEVTYLLLNAQKYLSELHAFEKKLLSTSTDGEVDLISKNSRAIANNLKSTLKKLQASVPERLKDSMTDALASLDEINRLGEKLKGLAIERGNMKAAELSAGESRQAINAAQGALSNIVKLNEQDLEQDKLISSKHYESARWSLILCSVVGILASSLLAFFTLLGLGRSIARIINSLGNSSEQVSSASLQLSNAAQELSNMSNEQASSIEETSSSLEEMGGMIDNNLANTEETAHLVKMVETSSQEGDEFMAKVQASMNKIHQSNERIKELVKVISNIGEKTQVMDEIVFQTKLLSFNASVEAERAGEHGRGFAVVAQEVGNLAAMSGKAAQEIAQIVKDSIKEAEEITDENRSLVDKGVEYVQESAAKLREIVQASATVSGKTNQVLTASKEQATGVKQINSAMSQLDKATQENAATAEETASTSEELSAQTEILSQIVKDLRTVINGAKATAKESNKQPKPRHHQAHPATAGNVKKEKDRVIPIDKFRHEAAASHHDHFAPPLKIAVGSDTTPYSQALSSNDQGSDEDGWEKL